MPSMAWSEIDMDPADLPVSEMSAPRSEVHNVSRTRDDSQDRLIERLFTFNCDDCGRTYGSRTKLSRHRRDKHGPQMSCYHCGKEFAQSRRWALEIHAKTCKAKFRYRANDERGYEVNRGQHANRRQEYHPYKSVPQSSANSYRPVSQAGVNRTKPSATVTLATLNAPLSRDNESDKLTVEAVDLSTSTQSGQSPEIETFSFYDQNDVMNGFTNLSVPEAQLQLATCKTIHIPLTNTNDLSDLINFDLPLTLDNTNESKDSQEDRQPSDSKIEVSHPTPTSVSLANHNTGTTATTTCTSSMSQEIFKIPTIGGTQQQQQQQMMMAPPPTTTVEQQQQQQMMMAPPPTTRVEQQQQQQQQMMMAPPPTTRVEQQQQQQQMMMAPAPTTTVEQQQQQMMMVPPQTSVQSQLVNPAKTTMQQPIEMPRRDYPIYSAPRATQVMCTVTKQMKVQCTNAISVGTTPSDSRAQMLAPSRVPVQQTVRVTRPDGSLYTPRTTDVTCTTSTPLITQPSPEISYNSRPPMNKPQRITPPRVSAQQTVRIPRTGQSPYFNPRATEGTYSSYPPYNYYKRPAHHNEPQILNLSVPKSSEVFQNLQTDILDLSTSRKSTPSTSEDEHPMTLEDTHQTRAQSVFSPDSPRTTPSSSPTPSETETPYSPTMPYYNPNSNAPVPEYEPTMREECSSTGFPPKPIPLEQVRSKDRYSYLLHDQRTMFAGAPSTFLKDENARYADRLRRKALQIGVRPENLSYCADGYSLTRTEFVQQGNFLYKLTSTLTPLPKQTRLREQGAQTENDDCPRCCSGCQGCGRVFICSKD